MEYLQDENIFHQLSAKLQVLFSFYIVASVLEYLQTL